MVKRIVVGVDRGTLADHAIAVGLELADAHEAEVAFVHGAHVEAPLRGISAAARWAKVASDALAQAAEACRARLAPFAAHPRLAGDGLDAHLFVRSEPSTGALLGHAAETNADLILIGAHRHRRVLDFGGTGRSILARSTCPVWVQPEEPRPIRVILAPIDLSASSALVLTMARTMALTFDAEVRVLNCFRPPLFAYDGDSSELSGPHYVIDDARQSERTELEELVRHFEWRGVVHDTIYAEGEPWTEILEREDDCDLIVMGTHGRSGFARAVLGSVAYRVLRGAHRPILVVPLPAHAYEAEGEGEPET